MRRLFRPKGVYPLVFMAVAATLYFEVFLDLHLKYEAEKYLTRANGARVNIGSLETNWLKHQAELKKIELADPATPMKNLVAFENVLLSFEPKPLFRTKLIIDNLEIKGITVGSNREFSGHIEPEFDSETVPVGILERSSEGMYKTALEKFSHNPLRHLGYLVTGIDIHGKIEAIHSQLKTVNEIRRAAESFNELEHHWENQQHDLPSFAELASLLQKVKSSAPTTSAKTKSELREAIVAQRATFDKVASEISTQLPLLKKQADGVELLIPEDIDFVRAQLNLPSLDYEDLTPQVVGPAVVKLLERISYWMELSRRKMPVGNTGGAVAVSISSEANGSAQVQFGYHAGNPSFVIKRAVFTSLPEAPSKITGLIEGLTPDPVIYGQPLKIELKADLPDSQIQNFHLSAFVDHTKTVPVETLSVSAESIQLDDATLHQSRDFRLFLKKAKLSFSLDGNADGDKVSLEWKAHLKDSDIGTHSQYKLAEEAIGLLLNNLFEFDINGNAAGGIHDVEVALSSELGVQLAQGLRHSFRHQLAAIDDNLKTHIFDEISPQKNALTEKLRNFENVKLVDYRRVKEILEELRITADRTLKS